MIEHNPQRQPLRKDGLSDDERAFIKRYAAAVAPEEKQRPGFFARLVGWWRMRWGLCPVCNSDAPQMYRCDVCNGYWGGSPLVEFPPNDARKCVWRARFLAGRGVRQ